MTLRRIASSVALSSAVITLVACGSGLSDSAGDPCHQAQSLLTDAPALKGAGTGSLAGGAQKMSFPIFAEALGRSYAPCPAAGKVTLGFCDGTSYQYVRLEQVTGEQQEYFYTMGTLRSIHALSAVAATGCGEKWYGTAVECRPSAQSVTYCSSALP